MEIGETGWDVEPISNPRMLGGVPTNKLLFALSGRHFHVSEGLPFAAHPALNKVVFGRVFQRFTLSTVRLSGVVFSPT